MINKNSTKEEVLAAVKQDGWALEFASEELQGDREVVMAALRKDGVALKYASDELKGDKGVVLEAVRQNGRALLYVSSKELQNDRDFIVKAVKCLSDDSLHILITDWIQTSYENYGWEPHY